MYIVSLILRKYKIDFDLRLSSFYGVCHFLREQQLRVNATSYTINSKKLWIKIFINKYIGKKYWARFKFEIN